MNPRLASTPCSANWPLCDAFRNAAADTWTRLADANRLGLRYGEETVTDSVLLDLMLKAPREVYCKAFSKWEEARNGADWELWFSSGMRGVGCRIQAKRLYDDGSYRALALRSRSRKHTQAETLIAAAKRDGRVPLHVFFTFPTAPMGKLPTPIHGCMVAHSLRVVRLHRNHFQNVTGIAKPWHEMVCLCQPLNRDPLHRIRENLEAMCPDALSPVGIGELPDYVQAAARALERKRSRDDREQHDEPAPRPDSDEESGARPKQEAMVRGVVVVRVGEE